LKRALGLLCKLAKIRSHIYEIQKILAELEKEAVKWWPKHLEAEVASRSVTAAKGGTDNFRGGCVRILG
jgi:hypothetical protein